MKTMSIRRRSSHITINECLVKGVKSVIPIFPRNLENPEKRNKESNCAEELVVLCIELDNGFVIFEKYIFKITVSKSV